jgi:hypothetical protein
MGQALLNREAQNVDSRCLDLRVLRQHGSENVIQVSLNNGGADTAQRVRSMLHKPTKIVPRIRKAVGVTNEFVHIDI